MATSADAVLVGYGGSEHSRMALGWADGLAATSARPLRVLVSGLHLTDLPAVREEERIGYVTDELSTLLASAEAPAVSSEVVLSPPGEALVREAASAYVTVIGARTQGRVSAMVNGSVSQYVTRHASRPVIVVREPRTPSGGQVVVGLDGSEHSAKAIAFASEYVGAVGGTVRAVHVREHRDERDERVEGVIAQARAAHPGVDVDVEYVSGSAGDALVEAAHDADLLVVGTRGRGAISALLLGSVSQSVLERAHCPVAVVR